MKRTSEILELLEKYEDVVKKAKEKNLISTKNFVGDIIETLVCDVLNAEKPHHKKDLMPRVVTIRFK